MNQDLNVKYKLSSHQLKTGLTSITLFSSCFCFAQRQAEKYLSIWEVCCLAEVEERKNNINLIFGRLVERLVQDMFSLS